MGEKFLEGKKVGARVKSDEYDKENLSDFALWKAHQPSDGQIFWDHPQLGRGRPGWHIECTAINYLKFPEGTDIHTGGVDLIFPHHTNEIAQAQAVYRPFVRTWVHADHVVVDGKKMAKSAGNFFTLGDLGDRFATSRGEFLRSQFLQSHYRGKINVTVEGLQVPKMGWMRSLTSWLFWCTTKTPSPMCRSLQMLRQPLTLTSAQLRFLACCTRCASQI